MVDPTSIKNRTYHVTFSDQIVNYVPVTQYYYVINYASENAQDTLLKVPLSRSDTLRGDFDKYIFDGVYLVVNNDWKIKYDTSRSKWNTMHPKKDYGISVSPFSLANVKDKGLAYPKDYNLIFDETHPPADTSTSITLTYNNQPYTVPKVNSNFRIDDALTGDPVSYAYLDAGSNNKFSSLDRIIFLQKTKTNTGQDTTIITWLLQVSGADTARYHPTSGDTLKIRMTKPFSSLDQLEITTTAADVNNQLAASQLDKIRVVPNPYVAATAQESPLPQQSPAEEVKGKYLLYIYRRIPKYIYLQQEASC